MEIIDFDFICRICWTSNSLLTMFNDEIPSLCEMLMACAPLEICEENGLPTKLCLKCSRDVEKMFAFRAKCIEADFKMRKYLNDHGVQTTVHYTHNPETCETIGTINTTFLLGAAKDEENLEETNDIVNNETEEFEECLVHEELQNDNSNEDSLMIINEPESVKIDLSDTELDKNDSSYKSCNDTLLLVPEDTVTYNCICNKKFLHLRNLKKHVKMYHGESFEKSQQLSDDTSRNFKCSICQHIFSFKNALIRHLRVVHRDITRRHFVIKKGKMCCLKTINLFIESVKEPTTEVKGIFGDLENIKQEHETKSIENEDDEAMTEEHLHTDEEEEEIANKNLEISKSTDKNSKESNDVNDEDNFDSFFIVNDGDQILENDDSNVVYVDCKDRNMLEHLDNEIKNENSNEVTSEITIFQCDYCLNEFTKRINLKIHLKNTHQIKKSIEENPDMEFPETITGELIKEIKVEYDTLKTIKPSIDSTGGSNRLKYPCKFCDRSYFARNNLHRHIKSKHLIENEEPERDFICEICSRAFSKKGLLDRHKECHFQRIAYQCEQCGDVFDKKIKLRFHIIKHQNKKQYQCDVCFKWFLRASTLKVHKRLHAEILPFPCTKCERSFSMKTGLEAHLRTHSTARPYVCSICKRAFRHPGHLDTHMKLHTGERPFSCTMCSKRFTTSTHYKYHMKVHLGQRDHKCKLCGRAFIYSSELKYHLLTHTQQKEIPCPVCGKMFGRTNQVTKHLRQVHKINKNYYG